MSMIPIMRPRLPGKELLIPYLERIDTNRWYSNTGPLCEEYEERLSELMHGCGVVSCSSATSGITACLLALLGYSYKSRPMVGIPGWTFCATASAVFAAGCRPLICDVDARGLLDPWGAGGCQAFVLVAPLGRGIDLREWHTEWDCPVVVDAAAGFDWLAQRGSAWIGDMPVVVSTHCTKVFGTGEGGFILCRDEGLLKQVRRILNQGMLPDKNISELGFNGKLSEYHCAVGLAELDGWEEKRAAWAQVDKWYGGAGEVLSTRDYNLPEGVDAAKVVERLAQKGIQARESWYGNLHLQDAYMKVWFDGMNGGAGARGIKMPMHNTEELRKRTIFLPKYVDMLEEEVNQVKAAVHEEA